MEIDPDLPRVNASLGLVHLIRRENAKAGVAFKRAIELEPNYADDYGLLGRSSHYSGNLQEGWEAFQYALLLNPLAPVSYLNAMS